LLPEVAAEEGGMPEMEEPGVVVQAACYLHQIIRSLVELLTLSLSDLAEPDKRLQQLMEIMARIPLLMESRQLVVGEVQRLETAVKMVAPGVEEIICGRMVVLEVLAFPDRVILAVMGMTRQPLTAVVAEAPEDPVMMHAKELLKIMAGLAGKAISLVH